MNKARLAHLSTAIILSLAVPQSDLAAADGPGLSETIRYLSSYLHDDDDRLALSGEALVFDNGPKCSYDSKIPLWSTTYRIEPVPASQSAFQVTFSCQSGECIRQFSDCDHRANATLAKINLGFRAEKQQSVEKALKHLFETLLRDRSDPFS